MTKPAYPRMKCAVCNRPMGRAAALLDGYPVGPVCAASKGLTGKAQAKGLKPSEPPANPDTMTIDMFGGH